MHYNPRQLSYRQTNSFSKIILDYIEQAEQVKPFFRHTPDVAGIRQAITERQNFGTDRALLARVLKTQYAGIATSSAVSKNIELLTSLNTFTVCTAHQPNIFTGHLYFIYKILHTIKLAADLNARIEENNFVPVFYMGSEDADLEELGHIYIKGQKYEWETMQTGAVGKMIADDHLLKLIDQVSGQLTVLPHGQEVVNLVRSCYKKGTTIQDATFKFVHTLFEDYGLIILIPDHADLKRSMLPIFKDDLFNNTASDIVEKTSKELARHYKVQAYPREINLFYLKDTIRNRLIFKEGRFWVGDSDISFTAAEIQSELEHHPERFSPNVILRGLYQEIILPNLAFVGGGGELAYWLELKDLFQNYNTPYPVLILRNSFMLVDMKTRALCEKLLTDIAEIFLPGDEIMKALVKKETKNQMYLSLERQQLNDLYEEIKKIVGRIDKTLQEHTVSLKAKALKSLGALETKMLAAEKKKFEAQQRQIKKIKATLYPLSDLQERVENFMPYYARFGKDFITTLYENSLTFQQKFTILSEGVLRQAQEDN